MQREKIAEALKTHREQCGFAVPEVIEKLKEYDIDISIKTLYSWESGFRQPSIEALLALCEIYNIKDVLDVFGYTKTTSAEMSPAEVDNEIKLEVDALAETLNNLDPAARQAALNFLRVVSTKK